MIIDTHVHLDDARYDDLDEVLARAMDSGVGISIIPGADPATLPRAVAIAEQYEHVYFAAGVHPYDIDAWDETLIRSYLTHPKCIAIGECGLDYYRLPEDATEKEALKARQKEVFEAHIALAKTFQLPLIVHVRDSSEDSYKILRAHEEALTCGGVLHCFNASEILLGLEERFYFGIGGVLTFKNARKLVDILPKVRKDRLVIETDAPYLTPHPHRGKRNEPMYCTFVADKMVELLGMERAEIEAMTTENAKRLFSALQSS